MENGNNKKFLIYVDVVDKNLTNRFQTHSRYPQAIYCIWKMVSNNGKKKVLILYIIEGNLYIPIHTSVTLNNNSYPHSLFNADNF